MCLTTFLLFYLLIHSLFIFFNLVIGNRLLYLTIPQFYLKCFGEHLYCYDKLNGNRFRNTPKNIGQERLFYDTKTSDGIIENFLLV